jgi:hypothetical protein
LTRRLLVGSVEGDSSGNLIKTKDVGGEMGLFEFILWDQNNRIAANYAF